MNIPSFITENKKDVLSSALSIIGKYSATLQMDNELIQPSLEMLMSFIQNGKCIRGSLVLICAKMYGGNHNEALKLAAAIEIIHSALLIHDDIMDNDILRRGKPTVFAQYQQLAEKKKYSYSREYGQAMAICVGDISFFIAQDIISSLECDIEIKHGIMGFISKELLYVGFAQMQDYEFACTPTMLTEKEILSLYKYKTGRYTFVLPLLSGALLSGKSIKELEELEDLCEKFGVLFQVKDDEIGLFTNDRVSGKPQGSDIREGKKTLLYLYMISHANIIQKQQIDQIFGKKILSTRDLNIINEVITDLKVLKYSQTVINTMAQSITLS